MDYHSMLVVGGGALVYVVYNYWDAMFNHGEQFSIRKAVQGLVVGAGVAVLVVASHAMPGSQSMIVSVLTGLGGTSIGHTGIKNIVRYYRKYRTSGQGNTATASGSNAGSGDGQTGGSGN